MPSYLYKCQDCNFQFDVIKRMKEHTSEIECIMCHGIAQQIITPSILIIPQDCSYQSPLDGTPITNRKARQEDMARNGCIEYDPCMRQDSDRKVKEDELMLNRLVDETVDREIALMPTIKRERLENEMKQGLTAEAVRL